MAKLGGVFLYDLDDLRAVAEANLRERRKEAAAAEALVDREVREFLDWQKSRDAVPLLVELRQRGEEIRRAEIEKARRRLGPLTPEQEEALDAATTAIVNKLLHAPTVAPEGSGAERPRPRAGQPDPQAARPVSATGHPHRHPRQRARPLAGRARGGPPARARGHEVEIKRITTTGDRILDRRLETRRAARAPS